MTDFDLSRLAEIPDPLAEPGPTAPGRPLDAAAWPPSPTRARRRTALVAAVVSALLFNAAWIAFVERRRDLPSLPTESILLGLAIPLAAAVLALLAVVRPGARGLGVRAAELVALVGVPPLLFAIGTLATAPMTVGPEPFVGPALRCFGVSAILAADPFVVALLVMRRSFVSSAAWRTAALGVASGALAAATMSVACANGGAMHVLVGHGTIMLAGGLVGAWAGSRITRA
jgi:hypothetical protein